MACGSPSVFQLLPEPLPLELKIAKDGSPRTYGVSPPWSKDSATLSQRGLQGGRFERPAAYRVIPSCPLEKHRLLFLPLWDN